MDKFLCMLGSVDPHYHKKFAFWQNMSPWLFLFENIYLHAKLIMFDEKKIANGVHEYVMQHWYCYASKKTKATLIMMLQV